MGKNLLYHQSPSLRYQILINGLKCGHSVAKLARIVVTTNTCVGAVIF